jgi:glyoxylase I family protein
MKITCDGIAHATLTVNDVLKTKEFYEELFQLKINMDDDKSFSLLEVGIPCWFTQWQPATNDRFDEKRVGLDHIAYKIESMEDLKVIEERLKEMKVQTAGIEYFDGKYPYVAFRDPDNIQTEFFIPKEA